MNKNFIVIFLVPILFQCSNITKDIEYNSNNKDLEVDEELSKLDSGVCILIDAGHGEKVVSDISAFVKNDLYLVNRLLDNNFTETSLIEKQQLIEDQKIVSVNDQCRAHLTKYNFKKCNIRLNTVGFPPLGEGCLNLPNNLKTNIVIGTQSLDINEFLFSDKHHPFIQGFYLSEVHSISFQGEDYLVFYLAFEGVSIHTKPVCIIASSDGIINLPKPMNSPSRLIFNDFNKDGVLDYVRLNEDELKIEFYSLKDNGFEINRNYYVGLKKAYSDGMGLRTYYFDYSHINWFGPNNSIYSVESIIKGSVINECE